MPSLSVQFSSYTLPTMITSWPFFKTSIDCSARRFQAFTVHHEVFLSSHSPVESFLTRSFVATRKRKPFEPIASGSCPILPTIVTVGFDITAPSLLKHSCNLQEYTLCRLRLQYLFLRDLRKILHLPHQYH